MITMKTVRIAIAALVVTTLVGSGYIVFEHVTAPTIGAAKAEYLAQRVLLDPTPSDIERLGASASVSDAVTLLFATPSAAEVGSYQTGQRALESTATSYKTPAAFSDVSYTYQLAHDPNQAELKLYYLWENIFSVDAQDKDEGITYADVDALHKILYDNATGNYLTMLQKVQTNYALDRYLNLTQSKATSPNENFARELMQLFMMGVYTPLDTASAHPNYSEEDVSSLSYILTGYSATQDHQVVFTPAQHFSGTKNLLGTSFNDPAGVIQYIAHQRSQQMALFLASKLMHYYLSDSPTGADISTFADVIRHNQFEILPSLKWLLSSDIMFEPQYMKAERYKTPLEVVASYYSDLYGRNDYSVIPNGQLLGTLNFTPYLPGSVFGRDGFTTNALFYSGTILENWVNASYRLVNPKGQTALPPAIAAARKASQTPDQFVATVSSQLYLGARLPANTVNQLVSFLGADMSNSRVLDVIALMFDQPEFFAIGGNLQQSPIQVSKESSTGSESTLVVVRLRGGMDYQQVVANTSDPGYASDRQSLALTAADSTPLAAGYVLNNDASALLPIVNAGQASFINAVGLPGQIRAHDIASRQMETGLASEGILANLQKNDPTRTLISLSPTPPLMMSGAASLQIGTNNQGLFPHTAGSTARSAIETTFSSLMNARAFPAILSQYFGQAMFLNGLANDARVPAATGSAVTARAASSTAQQFATLSGLINKNVGNTYYVSATGNYDDHASEASRFDPLAKDLFTSLAQFYTQESAQTKLTVVVFSEFGRTDRVNGSSGTDHGIAGGMIVLSNAMKLPTMLGSMHPSTDLNNWTDTQIDERDVWSTIFNDLYKVPQSALFGRSATLASAPVTIP